MALYYPLIQVFDFAGLAAATSIGGLANFGLLVAFLPSRRIDVNWNSLILNAVRIGVAAIIAFQASHMIPIANIFAGSILLNRMAAVAIPTLAGVILYLILCIVLRVPDTGRILRLITGRSRNRE
jgi:peptidoglycan biosynthesis protein MviN/MurJ (putative lipid II flippase)